MAISFVNGYLCTSGCDESKAKRGVDPHPSTNPNNVDKSGAPSGPGRADGPAVLFGGSLGSDVARVNAVDGVQPPDPAALRASSHAVDLLV
jgi:hypothetical protein